SATCAPARRDETPGGYPVRRGKIGWVSGGLAARSGGVIPCQVGRGHGQAWRDVLDEGPYGYRAYVFDHQAGRGREERDRSDHRKVRAGGPSHSRVEDGSPERDAGKGVLRGSQGSSVLR